MSVLGRPKRIPETVASCRALPAAALRRTGLLSLVRWMRATRHLDCSAPDIDGIAFCLGRCGRSLRKAAERGGDTALRSAGRFAPVPRRRRRSGVSKDVRLTAASCRNPLQAGPLRRRPSSQTGIPAPTVPNRAAVNGNDSSPFSERAAIEWRCPSPPQVLRADIPLNAVPQLSNTARDHSYDRSWGCKERRWRRKNCLNFPAS